MPVKFTQWDPTCETCKIVFERIAKKSEKKLPVTLEGKPAAHVLMTTILCFRKMHKECAKYYVRSNEKITIECTCKCHDDVQLKKGRNKKGKP